MAAVPDDELFDAYLARLGVERETPSVDHLFRLHRAHVERVPYETTWLFLDEIRGVDPAASIDLLVRQGRGGYCFHLNGALSELLADLGYRVTLHLGAVHHPQPDASEFGNHLVLIVEELPTDEHPAGVWYVDAGLGDALHEPLPLIAGTTRQGPSEFTLSAVDDGVGDWRLIPDADTGIDAMSFQRAPVTIEAFVPMHQFLSTSPESVFRKIVTVQRRFADGTAVVRGRVLTRRTSAGIARTVLATRDEWFDTLDQEFGLPLHHLGPTALDRLWAHVVAVGLPTPLNPSDDR